MLSLSCYPQVSNKSVICLAGVIRPAGLVIRPAGRWLCGKLLSASFDLYGFNTTIVIALILRDINKLKCLMHAC